MSEFIHQLPFRPDRCRLEPVRRWGSELVVRVATRPSRWLVGASVDPGWDDPTSLVGKHLTGAPVRRAFYVGRVDGCDETNFEAVIYEKPSGRVSRIWLPVSAVVEGERPRTGDRVHLWTWEELGCAAKPRQIAQIFRHQISEENRQMLLKILEAFKND